MLTGKNSIITGARSGIGLATLRLFARNGCNCWAIIHRNDDAFLHEISDLQTKYSVWIKPIHIDLSDQVCITAGVKEILNEKKRIDILVNAAGVISPNRSFAMTKMTDIRNVMEINFFSVLALTQLICRTMMKQKSGSIINISSVSAFGEDTSQIEYAASKAAIGIFSKKLAGELGKSGIRVNSVAPGLTRTKMISGIRETVLEDIRQRLALNRCGEPEEIAEVCLFLASDKSSYITGQTIKVDGGGYDLRLLAK